jgi:hypothetical protein
MDAIITYNEVINLVGVNVPTTNMNAKALEAYDSCITKSNVHCNASHAPKAPSMDGRDW